MRYINSGSARVLQAVLKDPQDTTQARATLFNLARTRPSRGAPPSASQSMLTRCLTASGDSKKEYNLPPTCPPTPIYLRKARGRNSNPSLTQPNSPTSSPTRLRSERDECHLFCRVSAPRVSLALYCRCLVEPNALLPKNKQMIEKVILPIGSCGALSSFISLFET